MRWDGQLGTNGNEEKDCTACAKSGTTDHCQILWNLGMHATARQLQWGDCHSTSNNRSIRDDESPEDVGGRTQDGNVKNEHRKMKVLQQSHLDTGWQNVLPPDRDSYPELEIYLSMPIMTGNRMYTSTCQIN